MSLEDENSENQKELERLFDIAQYLDSQNPEDPAAWRGSISDRILNQLKFHGIIHEDFKLRR